MGGIQGSKGDKVSLNIAPNYVCYVRNVITFLTLTNL